MFATFKYFYMLSLNIVYSAMFKLFATGKDKIITARTEYNI